MDDGFRGKLLGAIRWEDKQLRIAVEKAQLDAWYRTRECAEKTVAVTYDRLMAAKSPVASCSTICDGRTSSCVRPLKRRNSTRGTARGVRGEDGHRDVRPADGGQEGIGKTPREGAAG